MVTQTPITRPTIKQVKRLVDEYRWAVWADVRRFLEGEPPDWRTDKSATLRSVLTILGMEATAERTYKQGFDDAHRTNQIIAEARANREAKESAA